MSEHAPEVQEEDEYTPLAITPGDAIKVELTMPVSFNGQTHWVKTGNEIAALPMETADDACDRATDIALGTLFNAADRFKAILTARREQELADRNK